jgi:hypothetical protein
VTREGLQQPLGLHRLDEVVVETGRARLFVVVFLLDAEGRLPEQCAKPKFGFRLLLRKGRRCAMGWSHGAGSEEVRTCALSDAARLRGAVPDSAGGSENSGSPAAAAVAAGNKVKQTTAIAFTTHIIRYPGYVQVEVAGPSSIGDFVALIATVGQGTVYRSDRRVLVDPRRVEGAPSETEQVFLGEPVAHDLSHIERMASVVPGEQITRNSENAARERGSQLRVFDNQPETLAWDRIQAPSLSGRDRARRIGPGTLRAILRPTCLKFPPSFWSSPRCWRT